MNCTIKSTLQVCRYKCRNFSSCLKSSFFINSKAFFVVSPIEPKSNYTKSRSLIIDLVSSKKSFSYSIIGCISSEVSLLWVLYKTGCFLSESNAFFTVFERFESIKNYEPIILPSNLVKSGIPPISLPIVDAFLSKFDTYCIFSLFCYDI